MEGLKLSNNNLFEVMDSMDEWLENNGWAGWDPYSIRELPLILYIGKLGKKYRNKIWFRILNKLVAITINRFPYTFIFKSLC